MVARGERKKTAKLEVDGAASSLAESWLDEMQKASGRPVSGGDESEDVGAMVQTAKYKGMLDRIAQLDEAFESDIADLAGKA